MRTKAVLFDKDGTLFDFQKTWGPWALDVVEQLAAGDRELAERMDRAWGLDRAAGYVRGDSVIVAGTVEQVAGAVLEFLPDMQLAEMIDFLDETSARAEAVPVVPLVEFFDEMARLNIAVGIATNDSENCAKAHLRAAGIGQRFDFIAGYDSGFGGKPDPGMCLAFAQTTGIAPSEIVMVGDSCHDLQAGRAAGMQTVAVLTGVAEADELAPLADIVMPDIGGLAGWLKGQVVG